LHILVLTWPGCHVAAPRTTETEAAAVITASRPGPNMAILADETSNEQKDARASQGQGLKSIRQSAEQG
jgi:hypothetical protein